MNRLISAREHVQGMAYTNGTESFWNMLKRECTGTFHHLSKKHLDRYVTEFAGRIMFDQKTQKSRFRWWLQHSWQASQIQRPGFLKQKCNVLKSILMLNSIRNQWIL